MNAKVSTYVIQPMRTKALESKMIECQTEDEARAEAKNMMEKNPAAWYAKIEYDDRIEILDVVGRLTIEAKGETK